MIAYLHGHPVETLVLGYVVWAMVSQLPDPGQKFEWYAYFYHVVRTLMNSVPPQYRPKCSDEEQIPTPRVLSKSAGA